MFSHFNIHSALVSTRHVGKKSRDQHQKNQEVNIVQSVRDFFTILERKLTICRECLKSRMCTHHPKWQQKLNPPHLWSLMWSQRTEIWKDLYFVQSGACAEIPLLAAGCRHPGGGLALAQSVHPSLSLYLGLTWADGLTPAPCASNVRFPNAAVRAADTGQPMRGGYCHSGPMRRGLGAFGGSISLTVHSGRSSTSYFKACGTLACSAHMISSLLMWSILS